MSKFLTFFALFGLFLLSEQAFPQNAEVVEISSTDRVEVGRLVENTSLTVFIVSGYFGRNGSFQLDKSNRTAVVIPSTGNSDQDWSFLEKMIGASREWATKVDFKIEIKRMFRNIITQDDGTKILRPIFAEYYFSALPDLNFKLVNVEIFHQLLDIHSADEFSMHCNQRVQRCPFKMRIIGVLNRNNEIILPTP